MKNFAQDKPANKFIALYTDGSGANLYQKTDEGFIDHETDFIDKNLEWFLDAGYFNFIDLPDDYEFWYEVKVED